MGKNDGVIGLLGLWILGTKKTMRVQELEISRREMFLVERPRRGVSISKESFIREKRVPDRVRQLSASVRCLLSMADKHKLNDAACSKFERSQQTVAIPVKRREIHKVTNLLTHPRIMQ